MNQHPTDPKRGASRRSGNPAVRAGAVPASDARRALERRSRRPLTLLAALPTWSVIVGVLALVVAALLLPGVAGAVLLLVVAAILGWLLALAWPAISGRGRASRVLVVLLLVGYAGWKLRG